MKKYHLSQEEIAFLCQEMSLLYRAGVETGSGLLLLAEDTADRNLRGVLEEVARQTDEGLTLSEALRQTGAFPAYVCSLLRVGEETGRAEEALQALSRYYYHQVQMSRRLRSALVYPVVLMLVMLAVIVVLLTKVLPVFEDVYARLGGALTGVAGGLLRAGQVLDQLMPVLCVLLALVLALLGAVMLHDGFRRWLLQFVQRRFGHKGLLRKINTAKFAQALSMGLYSGLPAEQALELAGDLLAEIPSAAGCKTCAEQVEQGTSLAKALGECELMPAAQCRLLELGLRSGCGETVMSQIAVQLEEDADDALEAALGRIEPTLVLATSVLVGMILLAVMLPLLDIMATIG